MAGFTFAYDPEGPFGDRIDPATIQLNEVTLDPAATYRIVTNNFLAGGGDAFTVFTEGTNRIGGGDDLVALIDYLEANSPSTRRRTELPASERLRPEPVEGLSPRPPLG